MNTNETIPKALRLITLVAVAALNSTAFGQSQNRKDAVTRKFWAELKVFSVLPGEELGTYRDYGGGGVGPNGTSTSGIREKQRNFNYSVSGKQQAGRFLADVVVQPDEQDTRTRAQSTEYDLTDLRPRFLEIVRDEDGRVYWLSVVPHIKVEPTPVQFKAKNLHLERFAFPSSPVIVNDQYYVGRLGLGNVELVTCHIAGLASIDFSLLHLKGATPIGTFKDGEIDIAHESGATLRISDVKSGNNGQVLAGGPYRVWVRWNKPTQSIEEYREVLKKDIVSLKEQVKSGDSSVTPETLERLEELSHTVRFWISGNEGKGVEPDDLENPIE